MSPARLDLAVEWRSRRWRRLLNIIDRLPRDSAYIDALSQDDEFAAAYARDDDDSSAKPVRRMAEWSPSVEILTLILDRLGEVVQAVAALGGVKPRKLPRAPRPVTASERLASRRRHEGHKALVSRVLRKPPNAKD
jgi:hypothetical protein